MNRSFRFANVLVFCCAALSMFGLHANVGQCGLERVLTIAAYWEPPPQYKNLSDLKPAHPQRMLVDEALVSLLPPRHDNVVGDTWAFDVRQMLPLLQQFHPGATVSLSGQQGAYACLRAVSPDYYEIVFQFHADFNLEIREETEAVAKMTDEMEQATLRRTIGELQQRFEEQKIKQEIGDLQEAVEDKLSSVKKKVALLPADLATETEKDLANLKKELAEVLASLTEVTTTLEGLSGDLKTRLAELKTTITALEELVSNFDARLNEFKKELTATFDARLDKLEKELTENVDDLETALVTYLDAEFNTLKAVLNAQEHTLNTLTMEIKHLKGSQAYNEGVYLTPKQFRGHLLVSKDRARISEFNMECPAHEGNATLFVFGDAEEVSIPRMELISGTIDHNKEFTRRDIRGEITWTDTIPVAQAHEVLRAKFAARKSPTKKSH